jgi:hypothetical protein
MFQIQRTSQFQGIVPSKRGPNESYEKSTHPTFLEINQVFDSSPLSLSPSLKILLGYLNSKEKKTSFVQY